MEEQKFKNFVGYEIFELHEEMKARNNKFQYLQHIKVTNGKEWMRRQNLDVKRILVYLIQKPHQIIKTLNH